MGVILPYHLVSRISSINSITVMKFLVVNTGVPCQRSQDGSWEIFGRGLTRIGTVELCHRKLEAPIHMRDIPRMTLHFQVWGSWTKPFFWVLFSVVCAFSIFKKRLFKDRCLPRSCLSTIWNWWFHVLILQISCPICLKYYIYISIYKYYIL